MASWPLAILLDCENINKNKLIRQSIGVRGWEWELRLTGTKGITLKKTTPFQKSELGRLIEEAISIIDNMQQAELGQYTDEIDERLDTLDGRLNELGSSEDTTK